MSDDAPNALGLDFSQPTTEADGPAGITPDSPRSTSPETPVRKDKKPYVNPDRFMTGGMQREKLSEEALAEKMARIREQNAKIKQRRMHVQQDEDAFRKYEEEDRQRQEEVKKVQEEINSTRETYAKLKMDQVGNREWDSIKQSEGDNWDGGGWSGRDRRSNKDRGASDYPNWANEPTDVVSNWGDTPVVGEVSQWLPSNSSGAEKAGDDNDENTAGSLINWAGGPVPSTADWSVPSGDSNEPKTDWAGNITGANQDWGVTPSDGPGSKPHSGRWDGGERGWGRGDGERRGGRRGEGRGRGGRGGGRGRGSTREDKLESNGEKQDDAVNWAGDPVIVGDWNVPIADETESEENKGAAGPQEPSGDPTEPDRDWAGGIIGANQDWGTTSQDQIDASWKSDRGRGRGRGRGDRGRGRGEGRGRGGRGGGGKGTGRSESSGEVKNNEKQDDTINWGGASLPSIGDWSVPTGDEPKDDVEGPQLNWAGDPVPSTSDWTVPSGDSNEPERNWAGDIVANQDWGTGWQTSEDQTNTAIDSWKSRGRGRGRGDGGRGRGEGRGRGREDSDRGRGRGNGERGRGRGGRGRGEGGRGRGEGRGGTSRGGPS